MLNELDNLPRLDTILNGKPIGLRNHVGWKCHNNIGEIVVVVIDHNSKVRWFVPLNTTYAHCKIATILYKIDIYDGWMGSY
jgi:hypothetical protein